MKFRVPMKFTPSARAAIAATLVSTATAHGADRLVPQQYPTIQAAVDASVNGDRVLVAAGTYTGSISISGKSITIKGQDWSAAPQTHLTASGTVITCSGSGSQQVVLEDLLIRDATKGVYANNIDVVMNDCYLWNFNNIGGNGGCYQQLNRSLTANRCYFNRGRASYGGGVYIGFGSAVLNDCVVVGNEATLQGGGGFVQSGASLRLERCFVASQFFDIATNSTGYLSNSRLCNARMLAAASGASIVDLGGNISLETCADCDGLAGPDLAAIGLGVGDCDLDLVPDHCDTSCGAIEWPVSAGGNGHWYARMARAGLDWNQCRQAAVGMGGDLASIQAPGEELFISALVPAPVLGGYWNAVFVGGSQPVGSPASEGWGWSDGSPWTGVNWQPGQPNGGEGFLAVYRLADGTNSVAFGDWPANDGGVFFYLVEWSSDCNADGVVDFGQILNGELEDGDGDGVPDCCQSSGSCEPCIGDIDGTGEVNGIDLAIVINEWGQSGGKQYSGADITGDGLVDGADLAAVLSGWGACPR